MTLPLYVPGTTRLHRAPAGLKLGLLCGAGIALVLTRESLVLAGAALAGALLLRAAGAPRESLRPRLAGLAGVLAAVGLATGLLDGWDAALAACLRVLALALPALAVTLTTRASDLLDAMERALRPLERLGLVQAGRVSLAVALVLRFVPEIAGEARAIREAQAARGVRAGPVGLVVPLIVRTLARADAVAEAIDARGYPPDGEPSRPAPAAARPRPETPPRTPPEGGSPA
ncbi:Energy-coupling factor transporter transmembrane protein BioN [Methylobacterium crusticola]|uniref:Energy-coupling factor transporter transmembrane protein BioN n=1 Tax=Methylobacterium crusticola TaxID=1697972 RepID=A0ABQ4R049_9HYPH|nr:energy-coupling factor transporter transmembrane protein EcfT [Methylobacterium crusticola]GJD50335.1 Energy-coupling factor transporter transmembrane protein BioN [Methylobacterium crusticola]